MYIRFLKLFWNPFSDSGPSKWRNVCILIFISSPQLCWTLKWECRADFFQHHSFIHSLIHSGVCAQTKSCLPCIAACCITWFPASLLTSFHSTNLLAWYLYPELTNPLFLLLACLNIVMAAGSALFSSIPVLPFQVTSGFLYSSLCFFLNCSFTTLYILYLWLFPVTIYWQMVNSEPTGSTVVANGRRYLYHELSERKVELKILSVAADEENWNSKWIKMCSWNGKKWHAGLMEKVWLS